MLLSLNKDCRKLMHAVVPRVQSHLSGVFDPIPQGQRSVPGGPTHDAGPQPSSPSSPSSPPPPKVAAAPPAQFRQQQQQQLMSTESPDRSPPAVGNDELSGDAVAGARGDGGDGDEGERVEDPLAAERTSSYGGGDGGARQTSATAHRSRAAGEGVPSSKTRAKAQRDEEAAQGDGDATRGPSSRPRQFSSLGQGLAQLLEKQRKGNGEGGRKSSAGDVLGSVAGSCGAGQREGAGAGAGAAKEATGFSKNTEKHTVVDLTDDGDGATDDDDSAGAAAVEAAAEAIAAETAAKAVAPEAREVDDSEAMEADKPGNDTSPAVAGAGRTGAEGGSTVGSSSREVAASTSGGPGGKGKGETKDAGKEKEKETSPRSSPGRGEMLAPPMSPPKVVASAENDPQLDCTFKTLEAVHGAFYAPENSGGHGEQRCVSLSSSPFRLPPAVVLLLCFWSCRPFQPNTLSYVRTPHDVSVGLPLRSAPFAWRGGDSTLSLLAARRLTWLTHLAD